MNLRIWYENHKTFVYGILSTGIMLAILVILADWIIMPLYTKHGFEEEVPDVIEMHFNQAKELLNSRGFQIIKQSDAYNETYAESTIIIQKPVPYSLTKKGRRVYV
ncbi:MAG TPA: PASTA domain-containing protein, partial [Bacteroidales bacterium]|nr:PASTA domain-containing protein [Bacteroidales bacterium]